MGPKPVKGHLFLKWPRTFWECETYLKRILLKVISLTGDKPSPFKQLGPIINIDRGTPQGSRGTPQGMQYTPQGSRGTPQGVQYTPQDHRAALAVCFTLPD